MPEMSDQELLDALGVEAEPIRTSARTPSEERIIAGFEEIQRFVEEHGRIPMHGEDRDISERLYAVRLDQIRRIKECHDVVQELDYQNLLRAGSDILSGVAEPPGEYGSDEALLAELGVEPAKEGDVTQLKYVKSRAEIRAAEEIANRIRCEDFGKFRPLFDTVQQELESGRRETRPFRDKADIRKGDWFILSGQKVYVADVGEEFVTEYNRKDSRLRVIYDNGTESDILLRSLQRALNKDESGRRIIEISAGPLFDGVIDDEDLASGTIYVLRSLSDHPVIAENRDIVHKIGVTGGSVKTRIVNAEHDPTFLLAKVEIVATYELYNINRTKLENLIHRFFESARLDIQIMDRFGKPVVPREWFLVPLFVIDEMVEKIKDSTLSGYQYDAETATLIRHS